MRLQQDVADRDDDAAARNLRPLARDDLRLRRRVRRRVRLQLLGHTSRMRPKCLPVRLAPCPVVLQRDLQQPGRVGQCGSAHHPRVVRNRCSCLSLPHHVRLAHLDEELLEPAAGGLVVLEAGHEGGVPQLVGEALP